MSIAINLPSPYSQLWRWDVQTALSTIAANAGSGGGSGGGGIPEAPSDGSQYARQNAAWSKIIAETGSTILAKLITVDGGGSGLDADLLDGQHGSYYATATSVPVASSTLPGMDGTAAIGTGVTYARADHIHPTDTSRAPLASPVFTGTPAAPTAATADNSTTLATTGFVKAQGYALSSAIPVASTTNPVMDGAVAVGTGTTWARADHVHPNDTSKANLASPVFTGTPAAPTPATADSSTTLATTAFVKAQGYVTSSGVTAVTGTAPVVSSGGNTPAISMAAATTSVDGYLKATDWTTFNAKAPTASPTFTGVPLAPTPLTSDSSTAIATTAFVKAQAYLTSAVTSVTGTAPVVSSGGNTPAISMAAATATVNGYLASTDWATFNAKAPTASPTFTGVPVAPTPASSDNSTTVATTAFVKAQGYTIGGVTSVTGTAPVVSSGGATPAISMAAATTSVPGYLTAADWTTFNAKLADAPSDGTMYGRKSGAWSPVVSGGVIIADTLPASAAAGQICWESDTGNLFTYYTDADSSQWVMIASAVVPGGALASGRIPGEVATFAMNTPPTGWLECDGSLVSRTLYPSLFTAIGTTYSAGDGSTTFGLPDLRGEFIRGWDHGRGIDTGRVFGSTQAGDVISHLHAVSITSAINSVDHTHSFSVTSATVSNDHSHAQSGTFGSGGRSAAHTHNPSNNQNYVTAGGPNAGGSGLGYQQCAGSGTESADHSHNTGISGNTGGISANHTHGVSGNTSGMSANHTHLVSGNTALTGTETRPVNVALLYCIKY